MSLVFFAIPRPAVFFQSAPGVPDLKWCCDHKNKVAVAILATKKRCANFGGHPRLFSNTVFELVFVYSQKKIESALWWLRAWWIRQKMDSNFLDEFLLKGKRRQKNVVETKDDFQPVVRTHKLKACSQNHSSIKTPARSRNQSANFVPYAYVSLFFCC